MTIAKVGLTYMRDSKESTVARMQPVVEYKMVE